MKHHRYLVAEQSSARSIRAGEYAQDFERPPMKKRLPIPQFEFPAAVEAFNLALETTSDGERESRERAEKQTSAQAQQKELEK